MLFMLCSVIFPTEIGEYDGYSDYFLSRRAWFFGLLTISLLMEVADTWLKGVQHFASLGPGYPTRIALMAALCLTACFIRFHAIYAFGALIYFVSYIARHYSNIQ